MPAACSANVQMVAALVARLLHAYEDQFGSTFQEGDEAHCDRLFALSQQVLGSSFTKAELKALVTAYLHVPFI